MKIEGRIFAFATVLASLGLAGCVSDPTYGTGKSASTQLLDDMSSIATIGPKKRTGIEYKPRPELVKPVAGQKESLPQPQESVARAGDPSWPESPEERRKRLRAEIEANRDNPNFVSPIAPDSPSDFTPRRQILPSGASRREDYASRDSVADPAVAAAAKQAQLDRAGGSATQRKYLSEPPVSYRQPAATAAVGDLGEDEAKKERRRKAEATGSKSWRDKLGL
ncbi:hypothetical protein KHQ08_05125 [Pseudochrobactrum algeriensis]|uniref:DUF3035 domain-containing protein n=2 Tax=Pseudochrobactrum TaxID=354349 RepID=A0A7W8AGB5_9HYPH|nr:MULTISPECIES: hypothetical protein [Pseudochrobactrum]MBX8784100.1 hypothetical protein [Ochrobactrum sp. GRS2]MBX8812007.1 hypothetical protein [Ochrobactrum sp. MR34]KAB0540213.1 hypothetical protein F7P81_02165 [Pseudochrobactrum saccharolyticum]MBB5089720.1 hypothetical protein [Pseudochrobactrum saccharolyticum]MDP8251628.1 hypothetical protein [Pseudochrobactrum saccharolyticum]